MEKYTLGFIPPYSTDIVYLASGFDIDSICYQNPPVIPGTIDQTKAALYDTVDKIKSDIYKLRYYHREFLTVACVITKIDTDISAVSTVDVNDKFKLYPLSNFLLEPVENT